MNCLAITFNSQSNPHHVRGDVGVGLLSEIKINLFNALSIGNLRPTLGVNQPSTTNVKNTHTSTFTKRVGLKYISNDFTNRFHLYLSARPTPTSIKFYGGVL
jgi:hypothetical protein